MPANKSKPDFYLYILMRDDLNSLNSGKACAQAAHAANAFVAHVEMGPNKSGQMDSYRKWKSATKQSFGTTIVLSAPIADIEAAMQTAKSAGLIHGVVHDPTYPLRDGQYTHHIPLDTCAYVFGPPDLIRSLPAFQALRMMR